MAGREKNESGRWKSGRGRQRKPKTHPCVNQRRKDGAPGRYKGKKHGAIADEAALAEKALEEAFEEEAVLRAELDELDAHAPTRSDVTHNGVSADVAAGNVKDHAKTGADRGGIGDREEHASYAQRLHAGNLLIAAAIPGYEHAVGQRDALVAASGGTTSGFGSHKTKRE